MTEQQRQAADMLAKGTRLCDVARAIGVSAQTVANWRRRGNLDQADAPQPPSARPKVEGQVDVSAMFEKVLRVLERALDGEPVRRDEMTAARCVMMTWGKPAKDELQRRLNADVEDRKRETRRQRMT